MTLAELGVEFDPVVEQPKGILHPFVFMGCHMSIFTSTADMAADPEATATRVVSETWQRVIDYLVRNEHRNPEAAKKLRRLLEDWAKQRHAAKMEATYE